MGLGVLFGLLFCFLAFHREGVWTAYTPQDVARWHAQAAAGGTEPGAPRLTPVSHPIAVPQAPSIPAATRRKAAQGLEVALAEVA